MVLPKEELTEIILHRRIRKTVLLIITAVLLPHQEVAIRAEAVVHALLIAAVVAVAIPVHLVAAEVAAVAVEDKHEQQKTNIMIKKGMIAVCGLMLAMAANAQNAYDAERLLSNDLNGTARFVGMGGAMGALGGDMSVMGTNPAGIGIYRSNDFSVSMGFNNTATES